MAPTTPLKIGYVRLGKSGLKVSKIILGTMGFGDPNWGGGWVVNEEASMPIFKKAWELGINTWDTADAYSSGGSEVLVGKAIRTLGIPREEIVILTKCYYGMGVGKPNTSGLSRKHIFESVQGSLKRMQLDYIDVFQCHSFDKDTPIEETMDALHDIVKLGFARYIGMSTCSAWQFQVMQNYALNKGQTAFISMQNFHNAIYREDEREMLPTLDHFGVGSIPWSPLGRGYLCRPWAKESTSVRSEKDPHLGLMSGKDTAEKVSRKVNEAIEKVANARGKSMAQITLAWSLSNKTIVAPIIGTTRPESLEELVEATTFVLTKEEIEEISAPYQPRKVLGT